MEHINTIQETIDQNRDAMPTEVARQVLASTQKLYDGLSKLYKLTWTMVDSHAHVVEVEDEPDFASVELSHKTQTLIVEAVDERPNHPNGHGGELSSMEMPHYGMVLKSWVEMSKPKVIMNNGPYDSKDHMVIIHSIKPYTPKRPRE